MIARALERAVWDRCEYCRLKQEHDELPFQIDHIIAKVHGGPTELDNLALACFARNNHKGTNLAGVDLITNQITRLFHPRRDRWEDHFRWSGAALDGLTEIGRSTVVVLRINAVHRLQLREALLHEGVFP